jgi:amino-acid N-acetyltransferase
VLESGFIPIFPCIGWSIAGKPYNISSIQLAAALSVKLKADKLFFLTQNTSITNKDFDIPSNTKISQEGNVLALNVDEIPEFLRLNEDKVNRINDGTAHSQNLKQSLSLLRLGLTACRAGVSRVHVLNGSYNGTIP